MIISTIISAVIQLLVFTILPFIWWIVTRRKHCKSFFSWIGLQVPKLQDNIRFTVVFLIAFASLLLPGIYLFMSISDRTMLANYSYINNGAAGYIAAVFYAFIQTSLSEEILFRGFIAKRLIKQTNFHMGCAFQAILFGLIHVVSLLGTLSAFIVFGIFLFSTCAGWLMCCMNEKYSDGSILPGWILHALVNYISTAIIISGLL